PHSEALRGAPLDPDPRLQNLSRRPLVTEAGRSKRFAEVSNADDRTRFARSAALRCPNAARRFMLGSSSSFVRGRHCFPRLVSRHRSRARAVLRGAKPRPLSVSNILRIAFRTTGFGL